MNWDQIEIKWAEMACRLQAAATKSRIVRALDGTTPQDRVPSKGDLARDVDASREAAVN